MQIKIICVGKFTKEFLPLARKYEELLKKLFSFKIVEIKEITFKDKSVTLKKEREKIEKYIDKGDNVILCDVKGKNFSSSEEFSEFLYSMQKVCFIVGSSFGLSENLIKKYPAISFSKLTFSHQIFRIMLYEQIYRAYCIKTGHPYHK